MVDQTSALLLALDQGTTSSRSAGRLNTGTTIITFLMVFVIQQSQNKDSEAVHLKLDELLIALRGADERLVDAERLDEDKLLALAAACTARARTQRRQRARSRRRP